VKRFRTPGLKVPQIGWNQLDLRPHPLWRGLPVRPHVYFVHSYFCDAGEDVVVATSDYGIDFPAVVARGNVLGVQFHPEKSQSVGLRMVRNFVRSLPAARRRSA